MGAGSINQNSEGNYLRQTRSGRENDFSSIHSQHLNLGLAESPRNLQFGIGRPASSSGTHSPSIISRVTPSPATYLSPPSTQYYLSTSHLPQRISHQLETTRSTQHNTPIVRIDPAQDNLAPTSTTLPLTSTTMSAVAVQFDSRFEMGLPRSNLTWPGLDPNVDLLGHDLISHAGSDASMTPPSTSRSATSSPPRGFLTPEQRELKRQRDQARRDSKTSVRARRAMSTASFASVSPPVSMAEFSTASPMPIYTTSPSQISLLAEPVTTVPGSTYIPSYSTSPLPEPSSMFTSPFPTLPSSGYMGLDYTSGFPPPPTLMGSGRPPSLSEPGMLYPMPPVLPSGNGSNQENGHVRVVQSRPKPQCWEHGCNGRQFSTFSNLLRHQREKSGQAAKASCPNCGAEFTRTTARNGHLLHDKCKSRRNS